MTVDKPWIHPPIASVPATAAISAECETRTPFAGPPKLFGTFGPATNGLRTSTRNRQFIEGDIESQEKLRRSVDFSAKLCKMMGL